MHVDLKPLVRLQRTLGFVERLRILETERHGLEHLPAKHRHELLVLAPDLRLEGRAAGAELTDHVPIATREAVADCRMPVPADDLLPTQISARMSAGGL